MNVEQFSLVQTGDDDIEDDDADDVADDGAVLRIARRPSQPSPRPPC